MGSHIIVPWNIHLRGSAGQNGSNWWQRRKHCDDREVHPTLVKEQDLDHLGTLHDAAVHKKKKG